jgi:hypothetical protein
MLQQESVQKITLVLPNVQDAHGLKEMYEFQRWVTHVSVPHTRENAVWCATLSLTKEAWHRILVE